MQQQPQDGEGQDQRGSELPQEVPRLAREARQDRGSQPKDAQQQGHRDEHQDGPSIPVGPDAQEDTQQQPRSTPEQDPPQRPIEDDRATRPRPEVAEVALRDDLEGAEGGQGYSP
jgi:hypothetical protein